MIMYQAIFLATYKSNKSQIQGTRIGQYKATFCALTPAAPPSATPCPRLLRHPQRAAAAPAERPRTRRDVAGAGPTSPQGGEERRWGALGRRLRAGRRGKTGKTFRIAGGSGSRWEQPTREAAYVQTVALQHRLTADQAWGAATSRNTHANAGLLRLGKARGILNGMAQTLQA